MNNLATFLKTDFRILFNLRHEAKKQSVFKGIVVGVFAVGILAGLFVLFLDAFRVMSNLGGIGVFIIQRLFGLFFFGLGVMLVLSNIITAYAVYFNSRDVAFLMVHPLSRGTIALHKYLESALLSSWAFFFIMIPFMGAFAWHQKLPLSFAFWTIVFSLPFLALCSGIGVILILLAVRYFPRLKGWMWAGLIAFGIAGYVIYVLLHGRGDKVDYAAFMLTRFIPGIKLSAFPLWPSWWVSEGIMSMVRERWDRGFLLFGVLAANLLLITQVIEWLGNRIYYRAWERCVSSGERVTISRAGFGAITARLASFLPPECRAFILKDIRAFLRDPVQVIQGLIFFGLLGIYFFNLRNLHYHLLPPVWRNLIAFLNLFSLAVIMGSFCSRFVFPQLSLEGHAFWIIGLSPTGLQRVLYYKFALGVIIMLAISAALMTVSTLMLGVQIHVLLINIVVAVAVSFALCGLSLGLGALFMDLKQTNPVAIISGFGGTFNLVLSLVYVIAAILPFGFVCDAFVRGDISREAFRSGLLVCGAWLLVLTAATTLLPLLAGSRSLAKREY